jgi:hypothetical protein
MTMASTAYQTIGPATAMRPVTSIHGVDALSATFGDSMPVSAPAARTATMRTIE